jgi:hypothetical protein
MKKHKAPARNEGRFRPNNSICVDPNFDVSAFHANSVFMIGQIEDLVEATQQLRRDFDYLLKIVEGTEPAE